MALEQITNQPFLYVNNMQISNNATTPNTKIDVAAGQCRDSGNAYDIECDAATINAAVTGANGLDTGSLANSTWYAIHAIGDSTNTNDGAFLLSTSRTAPALPRGYDVFRHIGWALTDGSAHFLKYFIYGNGNSRKYFWDAVVQVVSGTSTTFAAVPLTTAVPVSANVVDVNYKFTPASAGNSASIRPTGSASTTNLTLFAPVASEPSAGQFVMNCNSSQSIDYKVGNASDALILYVTGFEDFI
jgi:hypothetical protein